VKSICDEILKSHRLCAYSEPPFNTSQMEEYGLFIHEVRLPTTLAYSEPQAYYFSDFFGGTSKAHNEWRRSSGKHCFAFYYF
jgi:hypothetical protein